MINNNNKLNLNTPTAYTVGQKVWQHDVFAQRYALVAVHAATVLNILL